VSEERVAVDWDDTLAEKASPGCDDWLPGAVEFVQRLQRRGFVVVIHSSRTYLSDAIQNKLSEAGLERGRDSHRAGETGCRRLRG
jgi:hypothetical protein